MKKKNRKKNPALLRRPNQGQEVGGLFKQALSAFAGWALPGVANATIQHYSKDKKGHPLVRIGVDAAFSVGYLMLPNKGASGEYKAAAFLGSLFRTGSDGIDVVTKSDKGGAHFVRRVLSLPTTAQQYSPVVSAPSKGTVPSAKTSSQAAIDAASQGKSLPIAGGGKIEAWIKVDEGQTADKAYFIDDDDDKLTPIISSEGWYIDDENKKVLVWGKPDADGAALYANAKIFAGAPITPDDFQKAKTVIEMLSTKQVNGYGEWTPTMGDFNAGYGVDGYGQWDPSMGDFNAGYGVDGYGQWDPSMGRFEAGYGVDGYNFHSQGW